MTGQGAVAAPVDVVHASWSRRVVAAVLDNALLFAVVWLTAPFVVQDDLLSPTLTLGIGNVGWGSAAAVGALGALLVMQAYLGSTPGKLAVAILVVDAVSARPLGPARTLLRWVLHLLDAILLIGYLRPLWNERRQTFADSIMGSVVEAQIPRPGWRRPAAVVSALVCVPALGLSAQVSGWSSDRGETCEATVLDPDVLHLTDGFATIDPGWYDQRRLGVTHRYLEPGEAAATFGWGLGPLEADGWVEVPPGEAAVAAVVRTADGGRYQASTDLADAHIVVPLPDGAEVTTWQLISTVGGAETARCGT